MIRKARRSRRATRMRAGIVAPLVDEDEDAGEAEGVGAAGAEAASAARGRHRSIQRAMCPISWPSTRRAPGCSRSCAGSVGRLAARPRLAAAFKRAGLRTTSQRSSARSSSRSAARCTLIPQRLFSACAPRSAPLPSSALRPSTRPALRRLSRRRTTRRARSRRAAASISKLCSR